MIRLENATKYYPTAQGRHYVFRDVTLEFPDGINIGILGRNGAGKTTLLRLLAGADMPNEGRIIRQGRISWPLGLTSGVQKSMSAIENARFACRIQGIPAREVDEKIAQIREFAELGKFFNLPVSTYSSGMKGRLTFAIAMAFEFDTYLIDEVTATGDVTFKEKAQATFKAKRDRASFIKCSHNTSEMLEECDAGVLLERGEFTYFPRIEDAVEAYLTLVTGGDEEIIAREMRKAEKKKARGESADGDTENASRGGKGRVKRRGGNGIDSASSSSGEPATFDSEDGDGAGSPRRREAKRRKEGSRGKRKSRVEPISPHVPAPMAPRVLRQPRASDSDALS
jgi:capsular polysaccharide transport system ATP-binding protein